MRVKRNLYLCVKMKMISGLICHIHLTAMSTTYTIKIKTGEKKYAGTDSDIFIILFGENDDTGEIIQFTDLLLLMCMILTEWHQSEFQITSHRSQGWSTWRLVRPTGISLNTGWSTSSLWRQWTWATWKRFELGTTTQVTTEKTPWAKNKQHSMEQN